MSRILIGIDCDVDKSGVTRIDGDEVSLHNLTFFDLLEFIENTNLLKDEREKLLVVIECGFLNKGNWHTKKNSSAALNAKIGENTGRNHQVAHLVVQMCEYLKVPFIQVKPTQSKINAKLFKKITGIEGRTNQEQRDSCMLIWGMR